MNRLVFTTLLFSVISSSHPVKAQKFIVKDGVANAEIVIAGERPRMVTLAALELQYYIEKISGARLPIVTKPGNSNALKIYVGRSGYTDQLGITDENLKYGAFRIASGQNWLALLGHDFDFVPPQPWPRERNDAPGAEQEWNKISANLAGGTWGYPWNGGFKHRWNNSEILSQRFGEEFSRYWDHGSENAGAFWLEDEGGTLNAVYEFLRTLGTRWYMPGVIGEVVPDQKTIWLPQVNRTVKPDYALRSWTWYNYSGFSFDDMIWGRRLGMNSGYEVLGNMGYAHGLVNVHKRTELKMAHPEYYALLGGKRDTTHRGYGTACYSSEGLAKEAVGYARFLFDHYDQPHVSLWPTDGFKKCECELCRDISPSDLVWGFVDRVAKELYKSHPDRIVSCGAYTPYTSPPESVEKFTPNVAVFLSNRGRPLLNDPERWESYWQQVEGWQSKLAPGMIMRVENNRYHLWGGADKPVSFPVIHPRTMAKDLQALKGISIGECCEESQSGMRWHAPGLDHLHLYVQGSFLWNAGQDVNALLEEYFDLFYGPASEQMKTAIGFAEAKYSRTDRSRPGGRTNPTNVSIQDKIKLAELLHEARKTAGKTVYGERIEVIINELTPIEELRRQLVEQAQAGDPRKNAPLALGKQDGKPGNPNVYKLKNIQTGSEPDMETTFSIVWEKDVLVFNITCAEPDMKNLYVTRDVWSGDNIILLLEPPGHSYYHIQVNPDGKIFDIDRGSEVQERWESQAQVRTGKGKDHWWAEVRIPVVGEDDAASDPNHFVAGTKPQAATPWYFNLGRIRVRDGQRTNCSFSPTGTAYIHLPDKFARLEIR